jgi:hypothetical protein
MDKGYWTKRLALYDELLTHTPEIERKGKNMIYTSDNGYMFSLLNKAGEIGIRLPKDFRKEHVDDLGDAIYKSYGAVMKDYVLIPEALLKNPEKFAFYLRESHKYVKSLKPK